MEIKKGKRYLLKPSDAFAGADGVFEVLDIVKESEVKELFLELYQDDIELYRKYVPEREKDLDIWVKYRDEEEESIHYVPLLFFEEMLAECLVREL